MRGKGQKHRRCLPLSRATRPRRGAIQLQRAEAGEARSQCGCAKPSPPSHARTHADARARTLQPPTQLYHARTCAAAPQAACYAEAACRSAHKMRLSQARFECLPIFPPCLSQTGRESSKHCNRVPPHMKTQCAALTGSVDRCFSHVGRRAEAWTVAWTVVFHTWTAWAMPLQNKLPPCAQAGRQFGLQFGNSDCNS